VHKLEFCLLAIGNLVEEKDKKLSKRKNKEIMEDSYRSRKKR
tara:strand:- start:63 stop:188 length:126 start_codon:yes stop_codon:yes gene_type:complete